MMVYAIFQCIVTLHQCQLADPPRWSPSFGELGGATYSSRAACEHSLGRLPRSGPIYYKCLGKHVDTWQ